jgi:hypothetical protein
MLQFGALLTYDTSNVNYDCNMFIIQASGLCKMCSSINYGHKKFYNTALGAVIMNNKGSFTRPFSVSNFALSWGRFDNRFFNKPAELMRNRTYV